MTIKIDKLVRSGRATISIQISKEGELIVRANHHTPLSHIERFLREKEDWIIEKKKLILSRIDEKPQRVYKEGAEILYKGNNYILSFGKSMKISENERIIYIKDIYRDRVKQAVEALLKKSAKIEFSSRISEFCSKTNLNINSLKISGAKGRWGSCSSKRNINLSWRLIMAPAPVADYVIIHELAHLAHPNHSKEFWDLVGVWYPHYKPAKKWLKENGHLLEL